MKQTQAKIVAKAVNTLMVSGLITNHTILKSEAF